MIRKEKDIDKKKEEMGEEDYIKIHKIDRSSIILSKPSGGGKVKSMN